MNNNLWTSPLTPVGEELFAAIREYVALGGIPAAHSSLELLTAANRLTAALKACDPKPKQYTMPLWAELSLDEQFELSHAVNSMSSSLAEGAAANREAEKRYNDVREALAK